MRSALNVANLCVTEGTSSTGVFWKTQHKPILKLLAFRFQWVVSAYFHAHSVSCNWRCCRYVQSDVRMSNASRFNGDVRPNTCAAVVYNFDTRYYLVCETPNAVVGKYSVHGYSTDQWLVSGDKLSHEQLVTIPTSPKPEHDGFVLIGLSRVPV